jgi:hypothetical protein
VLNAADDNNGISRRCRNKEDNISTHKPKQKGFHTQNESKEHKRKIQMIHAIHLQLLLVPPTEFVILWA